MAGFPARYAAVDHPRAVFGVSGDGDVGEGVMGATPELTGLGLVLTPTLGPVGGASADVFAAVGVTVRVGPILGAGGVEEGASFGTCRCKGQRREKNAHEKGIQKLR